MENVPLEDRTAAALALIAAGEDPAVMLSHALWPVSAPVFDTQPTISVVEFCPNGHARSPENTYLRPETGWRKCRVCEREQKQNRTYRRRRKEIRKVPCSYCGEPATASHDNHGAKPRCRACFYKHRKEMRRSHA